MTLSKSFFIPLVLLSTDTISGFTSPIKITSSRCDLQRRCRIAFDSSRSHSNSIHWIRNTNIYLKSDESSSESWESKNEVRDDSFPLEPLKTSRKRLERIQNEEENKDRFVQGDDLFDLRNHVSAMETELVRAIKDRDVDKSTQLTKEIRLLKDRDAEHVYSEATRKLNKAIIENDKDQIIAMKKERLNARSSIPHFNLEGLWVGKYGSHGYEMINVTYVEDTLIAYKLTGDKNVPRGEITFKADLSPETDITLEPIELTTTASKQWGMKQLTRFPGKGQVASEGFRNAQWMEGQLIMVGDYFSFAWVPIGHQIFFGRPSADLTLKMLKDSESVSVGANVDDMRELATRCMQETTVMLEEEECSLTYGSYGELGGCFE